MLEFHITDRKMGKTTQMINWLNQAPEGEDRWLVTYSQEEANRIRKLMNNKNANVISYRNVDMLRGRIRCVVAIDNLDLLLDKWIGAPVVRVAATGEPI